MFLGPELFASVFLASMLQVNVFAHLASYSAINVDMYLKGPKGPWRTSENADMWQVLWRVLAPRRLFVFIWLSLIPSISLTCSKSMHLMLHMLSVMFVHTLLRSLALRLLLLLMRTLLECVLTSGSCVRFRKGRLPF